MAKKSSEWLPESCTPRNFLVRVVEKLESLGNQCEPYPMEGDEFDGVKIDGVEVPINVKFSGDRVAVDVMDAMVTRGLSDMDAAVERTIRSALIALPRARKRVEDQQAHDAQLSQIRAYNKAIADLKIDGSGAGIEFSRDGYSDNKPLSLYLRVNTSGYTLERPSLTPKEQADLIATIAVVKRAHQQLKRVLGKHGLIKTATE